LIKNYRNIYLAPLRAEFYGVGDEVDQNLNHPALVTQDLSVAVALNPVGRLVKYQLDLF
jgi:hypothetical protein